MKRVLMLVEGQTEERFVKDVMCPPLWLLGIDPIPKIAVTKRVKRGPDFKGGVTDYQKIENDLRRLLGDTAAVAVTTFIDYYGLPPDFPGMDTRPPGDALARVTHVEMQWEARINHRKFRAFLTLHEFETLLFVAPQELCKALHQPGALTEFLQTRASFPSPEAINDRPDMAPSKRISNLLPAYRKTVHGPLVTKRIGLPALRAACAHFNDWLTWLERV